MKLLPLVLGLGLVAFEGAAPDVYAADLRVPKGWVERWREPPGTKRAAGLWYRYEDGTLLRVDAALRVYDETP